MIASLIAPTEQEKQHSNFQPITYPTKSLTSELVELASWGHKHCRLHTFNSGKRIPARPELLYFVQQGIVRLVSTSNITNVGATLHFQSLSRSAQNYQAIAEETFLGFVGARKPFEIVVQSPFAMQAYAHVGGTSVFWMYWHELDNWPGFRQEVMDAFRFQHQRQLRWLSTLSQRHTVDRLVGFLRLLAEEFGVECESGYYLPFPLTHTQIGNAVGATRVTVNRLMNKLCKEGFVQIKNSNLICLVSTIQSKS